MRSLKFVLALVLAAGFFACQKELDFETDPVAHGSLKKDASGGCLPSTINGIYTKDVALTANNFVDVQLQVTNPGVYEISTDTVNGMWFNAVGTLASNGLQTVRLMGAGTPTTEGTQLLTVKFDGTTCTIEVFVTGPGTPAAGFELGGAPGTCTGATLSGTFTAGTAVAAGTTVTLNINVTSAGTYNITTATVNGISFSGSGYLADTGGQTLVLNATGTPTEAGNFSFIISNGVDNCTFVVTVEGTTPVQEADYFPLTANSNWSFRTAGGAASDTTYLEVSPNTYASNGFSYNSHLIKVDGVADDSLGYRKAGAAVYHNFNSDFIILDNPIVADGQLLDTTLAAGSTWHVDLGTGTTAAGDVAISYDATVLERAVSATVANITYPRVIKVQFIYYGTSAATGQLEINRQEMWFANGVGIIYVLTQNSFIGSDEQELTRSQIF